MLTVMYIEINVFALIILLIIFLNIHLQSEKYLTETKLFLALLSFNATILIIDSITWIADGKPGYWKLINILSITLYYILNPLICMMWSFYADYQIFRDEKHLKKILIPSLIPILINTLLSIVSIWTKYLFYFDENNIYHRGNYFFAMVILTYLYYFITLIAALRNHNRIQSSNFLPLIIFAIPPFLGGIIQATFYGISIISISETISILIIFLSIQNSQLYTDHLTGLYNRRQLDIYLREKLNRKSRNTVLAGIMIDLNSFKSINDTYGHITGDLALKDTADILTNSFTKNDFIARYGGDEFVVILETKDSLDLIKAIDKLKENVSKYNFTNNIPYIIDLSIGADYYNHNSQMSVSEFLEHIDDLMYKDKQHK